MWLGAPGDDGIQLASHTGTGERRVGHQRQTFPREVADDGEHTEAPAIGERIRDEVEAAALVRPLRNRHRCTRSKRPLAATTLANNELFLAVDAEQLLVVHAAALTLQHKMQPPITEPAAFRRQSQQARAKHSIVTSSRLVAVETFGATPTSRQARRCE